MDLTDRIAIVTGAGRGIGRAIAKALAKNGCKVVLVSRTESQLLDTQEEIKLEGGEAFSIPIDLSQKGSSVQLIESVVKQYGSLDILVNNAGILYATDYLSVTEEEWDRVMNINLKVPFLLSQSALRVMKEKHSGYIINISSTAALKVPGTLATYGTSKKGLIGLSEALYETAKEYGVKVSVIYPGMTNTKMLRDFNPPVESERWMLPDDIAGCVLFLLKQSNRVVVRDIIPWAARYDKI